MITASATNKESITLKNAGLFQLKFWSNMHKPICWVKNALKKITVESES